MVVKDVKNLLKNYKKIDTDIQLLQLELEEVEHTQVINYSNTKVSNSNVQTLDNILFKKQDLEMQIYKLQQKQKKIETSLKTLNDREKEIIELRYIKQLDYRAIQGKFYREYGTIKAIEKKAFNKLLGVLNNQFLTINN